MPPLTLLRATTRLAPLRLFHSSAYRYKNPQDETGKITGGGVGTKGRTAGGQTLGSTAEGAPQKPKVFNFSTPGAPGEDKNLTEEQKREVEEHNREFEDTHDGGEEGAAENKVDKKFWSAGKLKKGDEKGK